MGKRSEFPRRKNDAYQTPPEPVAPVIPHLRAWGIETFAEPCAGEGKLIATLEGFGLRCTFKGDIERGFNALTDEFDGGVVGSVRTGDFDAIVTNPPWTREILHPMIRRFQRIAPTWLLFDADWAHTVQADPFLDQCSDIVSAGRVKWIEGSEFSGKDNCAWYRFHIDHKGGPKFRGKRYRPELDAEAEMLV